MIPFAPGPVVAPYTGPLERESFTPPDAVVLLDRDIAAYGERYERAPEWLDVDPLPILPAPVVDVPEPPIESAWRHYAAMYGIGVEL